MAPNRRELCQLPYHAVMAEGEQFKSVAVPPSLDSEQKYCKRCLYSLQGLASVGRCPECGRQYDLAHPESYTLDPRPPTIWKRLWSIRAMFFGLLAVAVSWDLALDISVESTAGFLFLYPLWSLLLVCLLVDMGYRISNHTPSILAVPAGAAIGLFAGLVNVIVVDDLSFVLLPIVSALSGGVAGLLVFGAETKELRDR